MNVSLTRIKRFLLEEEIDEDDVKPVAKTGIWWSFEGIG